MKKRWGSYTPSGDILLNPDLIKYPSYCIDYVIIHEMCHAKYNDHSKDFYNLLSTILPDWEYRKRRLEEMD
jgi:predicted metal-dependent hydrolase